MSVLGPIELCGKILRHTSAIFQRVRGHALLCASIWKRDALLWGLTYSLQGHYVIFKAGIKPEILKNRECHNFQTITKLYIKACIFGMEMSQRINF